MKEIKEFIDYLLLEKGLSKNTILSYKKDIESFNNFFEKSILEINKEDTYNYINFIKKSYKENTIARRLSSIRNFYKFLEFNRYIDKNPFMYLEKINYSKRIPSHLEQSEILKIVNAIDNSAKGKRDNLILDFLIFTGARISEVLNLKLSDIDEANLTVKIKGKGSKFRILPVFIPLINKIKEYNENFRKLFLKENEKDNYLLFPNITRNNFWHRIKYYAKKAEINKKVSPHIFRHSLATLMINNGADLRYVQELLGHSNVKTTEIYTHISKSKLREVYNIALEEN